MKRAPAALAALAALWVGCGYGLSAGASRFAPEAERVFVRAFENRTADAEVGGWLAGALREELVRVGRAGGEEAPARFEGEIVSSGFGPSSQATYQQTLVVRVRLMVNGKLAGEQVVARSEDYLGGIDSLESEGRRRVALRRLAAAAAREIVERFESF